MPDHFSTRITQFAYFDCVLGHPDWTDKRILDFGGNIGGFLSGAPGSISHDDYWCVDIHRAAIDQGSREFPRAHFVHYDRYSSEFNPSGVRNLPVPDCGLKFDFIIAFSVFSHVHKTEMLDLSNQLQCMLAPSGAFAFTFIDPSYDRSLSDPSASPGSDIRTRLKSRNVPAETIDELVSQALRSNWCILIDDKLHVEPGTEFSHQQRRGKEWESYITYYKPTYLATLFPGATIVQPVRPEWQHCCVLSGDRR